MKRSTFDALVSFLQGIFWAFLLIGAWLTYHIAALLGTGLAVFITFLFIFFGLVILLLLETIRTYRLKADEVFKQTQLLEELKTALKNRDAASPRT